MRLEYINVNRTSIFSWMILLLLSIANAPAAVTLELKPVVNGLTNITSITSSRDGSGRLFITQQSGQVRIFNGTQLLATNFLDISTLISTGGERGLLSIAFHPGYKTNGLLYAAYTAVTSGDLTLARYSVSADPNLATTVGSQVLLRTGHSTNSNHNGGQLQFGPDGYLYYSTGDGGSSCDPNNNSQNLGIRLGKMLRLDVNTPSGYLVPPSNPFVGVPGALPEIWAYGLRNAWKFSFDRMTGDLWIGDVGQGTREEVDWQLAGSPGGENYGWRLYEGTCTNCCSVTFSNVPTVLPILEYGHSPACSITGGYRYRGSVIAPIFGTYFYGDYCSGQIWGATNNGSAWGTAQILQTNINISAFGEDEAGELYVARYASPGTLYRLVAHDTIGDGIADWWRAQYFTAATPTNAFSCATCDPDGDGSNNRQEYLAGTKPLDATSALRVTGSTPTGSDFVITFASASNKFYQVQRTTNLDVTTVWTTITNNVAGTGAPVSVIDPGAAVQPQSFYRVQLRP